MAEPLPTPIGKYSIGSVELEITDPSRTKTLADDEFGRKLFIKIWYPATQPSDDDQCERLWQQLRNDPTLPAPMRLAVKWINRYDTHTFPKLKMHPDITKPKIVIYNHGYISFASDSTSLSEDLAGNGHLVIGVQHVDQFPEFKALESRLSKEESEKSKSLAKTLNAAKGKARQELILAFYRSAKNTNAVAHARALDSQFVLNNLDGILNNIPRFSPNDNPDPQIVSIGLSMGGAVSMEFAKLDQRVTAAINIDGGIFGKLLNTDLKVPCLMIYSDDNRDINQLALATLKETSSQAIDGSKHLNFHDIALIFPRLLKALGHIGSTAARQIIEARNRVINDFINGF